MVQAAGDQTREGNDQANHDDLDQHERHRTPVDLPSGHAGDALAGLLVGVVVLGRDAAQVEQRKPEGRVHERGLHIHRQQHAEPNQVDAQLLRHRPEQRNDDERQLEKVEEKGQYEHQNVHDDEEAQHTAWQAGEQMLHPDAAIESLEHQVEHRGADENEQHEGGELGRGVERLLEQIDIEPLATKRHDQRAHGAHRAAFGRRGHAQENGAQHEEDQRERRHQSKSHAFGHLRQQIESEGPVEQRQHQRKNHAEGHGHDDGFIRRSNHFVPRAPAQQGAVVAGQHDAGNQHHTEQNAQRTQATVTVGLANGAGLGWQRRGPLRLNQGHAHDVSEV